MPRRISFSLTEVALLAGRKNVTRRIGWDDIEPGQELIAVRKSQGLKKGERQVLLGKVLITAKRRERLICLTQSDVAREGFPKMIRQDFIAMFCKSMGIRPTEIVTRIGFEFTPSPEYADIAAFWRVFWGFGE